MKPTCLIVLPLLALPLLAFRQDLPEILDARSLHKMCENMGYTMKDLNTEVGKEKWEIDLTQGGLNIPVACEITTSTHYVWLTVNLGDGPSQAGFSDKASQLLEQNFAIQPCQFYVTKKKLLMMGCPIDNRHIQPTAFKRIIDKLAQDVVDTKKIWGN